MSTQVEINGISFLPIKDAAKAFSYSRDYVARLAREGKIVATQVNRQWLIDSVSLQNFAEASELEQSVRKQQLSLERKREQVVKQEVVDIKKDTRIKMKSVGVHAQMVAACVLCLGIFAGAGVYTTTSLLSIPPASVANLGSVSPSEEVVYVEEIPLTIVTPQPTTLYSSEVEYPLFVVEEETRALSIGNAEGIFLLGRDGDVRTAEDVAALFSDDVEVEFLEDNTGLVKYQKENGAVVEYPFVSVPTGENKRTATATSAPLEVI
jgi:hypothetical protein